MLVQPSAYPTNMYAAIQQPADAGRVADYGEIGQIPARMFEMFSGIFAGADAPDLHDVADAIAKLVAAPKGERPARVLVAFGADAVNEAVAPVQQKVIEALGLGLLSPSPLKQST